MRQVKLSRRSVLLNGWAFPLAYSARPILAARGAFKNCFLLLEGLDKADDDSAVASILEVFFERGIPVCIGFDGVNEAGYQQSQRLAGFLRGVGQIADREPGLVELVPVFAPSTSDQRYFQLRAASELRRLLSVSPLGDVSNSLPARIVTVLDRTATNTVNPYAFRAAGFRVLIRENPPDGETSGGETKVSSPDWGLMSIEGMTKVSVFDEAANGLESILKMDGGQLIRISFAEADNAAGPVLLSAVESWADALRDAIWNGDLFVSRPADHLLQGNPGASKYLALMLDQRAGVSEGMEAFAHKLDELGFSYTLLLPTAESSMEGADRCIFHTDAIGDGAPDCVVLDPQYATTAEPAFEIIIHSPRSPNSWTGLRSDARFQIALATPRTGDLATRHQTDPMTDQVELIGPAEIATEFQRRVLLRQLQDLRQDGRAHFYSVRGFVDQILAPEPALKRLWSVRRRLAKEEFRQKRLGNSQAAELLQDARLAWSYISNLSNSRTGICVGTATLRSRNQGVTLWDVGSQIFGTLSAWRIGMVEEADAAERCQRLVSNLPDVTVDGLRLPPSIFHADTLLTVRSGYDSCDTGRFLLSLDALARSGLVSREHLRAAIDRWDLHETIRDGRPYGFSRGRWVDESLTHCTPYTAQGFLAWGMEVQSAYPTIGEASTGDDQMRLLHRAAFLGQFGAEPLLLEAVERNQSPESKLLSDLLFDAQLSWFEETGRLRCVSESPLDMEPWFIYQGLRVDREGADAWVVNTKSGAARYQTPKFMERAEVISAKSAYLWAATYPHFYSDRLVALMREKARLEGLGFSPGVYASTMKAMAGYSDLNTNGIILTAIAKLLSA